MTEQFNYLFSPIDVGNMTLSNRIVVPGHFPALRDEDSLPGERLTAYWESKAKGGAAMICSGIWAIHKSSPNPGRGGYEFHKDQTTPLQVPGGHDEVFAEALHAPHAEGREEKVLRTAGDLKAVLTLRADGADLALRDLARDPHETGSPAPASDVSEALRARLDEVFGSAPPDITARGGLRPSTDDALGPAEREALEALGYVQ